MTCVMQCSAASDRCWCDNVRLAVLLCCVLDRVDAFGMRLEASWIVVCDNPSRVVAALLAGDDEQGTLEQQEQRVVSTVPRVLIRWIVIEARQTDPNCVISECFLASECAFTHLQLVLNGWSWAACPRDQKADSGGPARRANNHRVGSNIGTHSSVSIYARNPAGPL